MTTQLNNYQMKILLNCIDQIEKAHNMDCDKWILDGTNFKNIGDYQSVCQLNHNDVAYTNAIKDYYDCLNNNICWVNASNDVLKELEALGYIKVVEQSIFRTAIQLIHV